MNHEFSKSNRRNSQENESSKPRNPSFIPIQTKLKVGQANDKYEQEADSIADKITNQGSIFGDSKPFFSPRPTLRGSQDTNQVQGKSLGESITPLVQKQEAEEPVQMVTDEEPVQKKQYEAAVQMMEEEEPVQTKAEEEEVQKKAGTANPQPKSIESRLNSSKGGGQKLEGKTKNEMESGFGADFSNVNIHTDDNAAQLSQDLGAKAFAHGNDVYFNKGQYDPQSSEGKHLLAHELTHTIQQKGMVQKQVQRAETDTRIGTSNLKDSKDLLNKFVNETIEQGRKLGSVNKLIEHVYISLALNSSVGRSAIENWVTNSLGKDYQHQPEVKDTKYKDVPAAVSLLGDGKIWRNPLFDILNPSIKLNGNLVGSDKLGHFFQQGFDYFKIADIEKKGEAKAKEYGESTEEGGFGINTTGIYSNADLSANFKGLSFWRDLLSNPNTYKFDISKYITSDWNEESNPNFYGNDVGQVVWKNLISGINQGYISYPDIASAMTKGTASASLSKDQFTGKFNYTVPDKKGNHSITFTGSLKHLFDQKLKAKKIDAISGVSITITWKHTNGLSGEGVLNSYKEKILQGTLYSIKSGRKTAYRKFKFYT